MPVIVSLLRGVNVGGNRQVKMAELRSLYESHGLRNVETFINSGNVICTAPARGLATLPKRLDQAIEKAFGFTCDVVVRTTSEMREVIARNPFAGRSGIDPARLLITFLSADPAPKGIAAVSAIKVEPEELRIDGRQVYIYYANGLARPALPWMRVAQLLGTSGTGRNLTTVQKLLAIAERLEATP